MLEIDKYNNDEAKDKLLRSGQKIIKAVDMRSKEIYDVCQVNREFITTTNLYPPRSYIIFLQYSSISLYDYEFDKKYKIIDEKIDG